MDWKDTLRQFAESTPLPEGVENVANENIAETKKNTITLRVIIDKKGRKGKTATIVEGFTCDNQEVENVAATIKRRLGTGGSARGGEILIQGERSAEVKRILADMGYKVK